MQQILLELKNIKPSIFANYSWPFLPSGVHKLQVRNFFLKYKMWNYHHFIGNQPSKETGNYLLLELTQENPYDSDNNNHCIPWTHESVIFYNLVMIPWKPHTIATLGCPHRFFFSSHTAQTGPEEIKALLYTQDGQTKSCWEEHIKPLGHAAATHQMNRLAKTQKEQLSHLWLDRGSLAQRAPPQNFELEAVN